VPPLAVPDSMTPAAHDELAQSPAVQLFARLGQAVHPSFALTANNAPLVADICRRLDGLPLAIELAAARITHLTVQTLRERLDRRLPLLTGGARDRPLRERLLLRSVRPPRQGTLANRLQPKVCELRGPVLRDGSSDVLLLGRVPRLARVLLMLNHSAVTNNVAANQGGGIFSGAGFVELDTQTSTSRSGDPRAARADGSSAAPTTRTRR